MTVLRLTDVHKSLTPARGTHPVTVLQDVRLTIPAGERLAVLGRSGSGKSTLLSLLGLLDAPTCGRYEIDGTDAAALSPRAAARLRGTTFGFVYQRFCLMSHLTAAENVETALLPLRLRRAERRRRSRTALEAVGLGARTGHRPSELSGGEQQRVGIARALAKRPAVILADEPTGSLDVTTGAQVMAQLHALTAVAGSTLVVVTHDERVAESCDRTVLLDQGRVSPS